MDSKLIEALGDELFHALRERRSVPPLTQRYPDLTLEMASRELNTNREYLSRAISYHRAHFTDLVNKHRVQEVMKVFSTPADARNKLTLQVLATEVGFNSNSVFIDAFRKVTGMTPTQFREHLSENSTQPTS